MTGEVQGFLRIVILDIKLLKFCLTHSFVGAQTYGA